MSFVEVELDLDISMEDPDRRAGDALVQDGVVPMSGVFTENLINAASGGKVHSHAIILI